MFVIGAGLMGSEIALVCAQSGYQVILNDISQDFLDKAVKGISWSVEKFVEKGKLSEKKEAILGRLSTSLDYIPGPRRRTWPSRRSLKG